MYSYKLARGKHPIQFIAVNPPELAAQPSTTNYPHQPFLTKGTVVKRPYRYGVCPVYGDVEENLPNSYLKVSRGLRPDQSRYVSGLVT